MVEQQLPAQPASAARPFQFSLRQLLAAFFVEPFARFLARFRRHIVWVERAMGALLILTGLAFLTGSITTVSFWLLEVFPALGTIG